MSHRRRILISLMLCAALLLVACGGSPSATTDSPAPADSPRTLPTAEVLPAPTEEAAAAATTAPEATTAAGGADPSSSDVGEPDEQPYDSTYFQNYGVNPFVDTRNDPQSTFGMDVDTASYGVMRRFVSDSHLPAPDSVRVEEYLNNFNYRYPQPENQADFGIYTEVAPSPFGGKSYDMLHIGIQARMIEDTARSPASLTFVIDGSGSMDREGRLETVKQALTLLVEQLRDDDRIAIVVYSDAAWVALPATSGAHKQRILNALDDIQPDSGTNVEAGLDLGFAQADKGLVNGNNLILLCSDGVANNGVTDPEALIAKYSAYTAKGIRLSTLGFGMGNYNDVLMEELADHGDGFYRYIDTLDEAEKVFVDELVGTLQHVARDAKIQVEFNPDVVQRYRLVGYENRAVADRDFRNDDVDAGEVGAGHSVTALYEIKRHADAAGDIATVRIRYQHPDEQEVIEQARTITTGDLLSLSSTTPRFRLAASVATYAELLRHERWTKGDLTDKVVDMARDAATTFEDDPDIEEFARLVNRAYDLAPAE